MARLLGPDFMSLQVRDLAISGAFYTEQLGLLADPAFNAPGFMLFESTTIPFGLSEARVDLDAVPQLGWGVALWLDCDDVDALHERLAAAGITIVKPPFDGPFGRTLVFADPDGYQITANQNDWNRFPLGGKQR